MFPFELSFQNVAGLCGAKPDPSPHSFHLFMSMLLYLQLYYIRGAAHTYIRSLHSHDIIH